MKRSTQTSQVPSLSASLFYLLPEKLQVCNIIVYFVYFVYFVYIIACLL